MKIGKKLDSSIRMSINESITKHQNVIDQLFRDDKISHDIWDILMRSAIDCEIKAQSSVLYKISIY